MATTKQKRLMREVFESLRYELSTLDWNDYGKQLLDMTLAESKRHDNGRPEHIVRNMSTLDEARYFAIKRIVECLDGYKPDPADFLMLQRSVFPAYSIAKHDRFLGCRDRWLAKHNDNARMIASFKYSDLI